MRLNSNLVSVQKTDQCLVWTLQVFPAHQWPQLELAQEC